MDGWLVRGEKILGRFKRAAGSPAVRGRFMLTGLFIRALEEFESGERLQPTVRCQRQPSRCQQEQQCVSEDAHCVDWYSCA